MSQRRLLAVLALLLGLLGALLVLLGLHLPGRNQDLLAWLGEVAVRAILALAAIVGSLLVYGRRYQAGGVVNVVIGIALLLVGGGLAGPLLVVFSGILGLVAGGTFDERPYRR